MANWTTLLKQHHTAFHPDGELNLVLGQPASAAELDCLATSLKVEFPVEFCSFYMTHNGFGISHEGAPGDVSWFFKRLDQITGFAQSVRNWFSESHEKYAERFIPFIDFENGDGLGYMTDESGKLLEGLFGFEHELYEFDKKQDVNEFLTYDSESIQEFLHQY